ncbi:MAG: MurR/RpiR family transcriptional regulator [Streptococcaceae bacterium]|jgi:DNA-binding MurR/RpiR family transcriptional regulator|nr:MurR/RpiR family transcriptional regulator [Streptococcaceae bacterium]
MQKLSESEMYAWNFLEEHHAKVQVSSITLMADLAFVSPATIIRTLKKRGFDGYADYKNWIKRQKADEKASQQKIPGLSNEANDYVFKNLDEVQKTIGLLDADNLNAMIRTLSQAQQIMMVARDACYPVGDAILHRLQSLGKSAISRYYESMVEYAEDLTERDVLFAVSFTGEEEIILKTAKMAKEKGTKIIALLCDADSSLAQYCDYYLLAYRSLLQKDIIHRDSGSILPLELVARILMDLYVIREEKGTIKEN